MTGAGSLTALARGASPPRPPWIPLLGTAAAELAQVDPATFATHAHTHATALLHAAGVLHADVITVGLGADPAVGADAARRLQPALAGRGVAGCLAGADVTGARAYCEAGAGMLLVVSPDRGSTPGRFRTLAGVCAFYRALAILVAPDLDDGVAVAAGLGLHGAVVPAPRGDEPGIIGGGVPPDLVPPGAPPRPDRFFWALPGQVPPSAGPEVLDALGRHLTGAPL